MQCWAASFSPFSSWPHPAVKTSKPQRPEFVSEPVVSSWGLSATHPSSLSLSFLVCKMGSELLTCRVVRIKQVSLSEMPDSW